MPIHDCPTRKSTSLCWGFHSPRATEPNTQSCAIPRSRHSARIAGRRSSTIGGRGMVGEGFEPPAVSRGFRGQMRKRRRKRHTGREVWAARWARRRPKGAGAAGRASGGRRAGVARPRAHGATWGLAGPVARGQRVGVLGGHGSFLTRTHALGPTEELAEAIEFVSGGCHRCHRYRNRRPTQGPTCSS